MKQFLKMISLFFLVFSLQTSFAQNSFLSVQGVVRNANGTAVENGQYTLAFNLYDALEGGTKIWGDTINNVDIEGGIYTVILGSHKNLSAPFDRTYFLGVAVEGGTELIPRARLTSSPYALSLIGDDNIFPNSGNVGVGSSSPPSKLTVAREDAVLGLDAEVGATNTATITSKADGLEFSTEGATNGYYFAGEVTEVMRIKKDGKVNIAGQLGVGVSDPQHTLHVVGDNEQVKVEGTDNANIVFTKTSGSATLGFDAANGDDLKLSNAIGETHIGGSNIELTTTNGTATIEGYAVINGETKISKNGETLKLLGTNSSFVGLYPSGESAGRKGYIGFLPGSADLHFNNEHSTSARILFHDQVYIDGSKNETIGPGGNTAIYRIYDESGQRLFGANTTGNIGLFVRTGIRASQYFADSDRRIKKNLRLSNGTKDIETLMKIEVTDYKHKDVVKEGTDYKKGLIAQQVKSVFPEGVRLTEGEIPNIYSFPEAIDLKEGTATIKMSMAHNLIVGDELKIILEDGDKYYTVSAIDNAKSFKVENWEESENTKEVFIFGKKINDFHVVDYDRVFTLNVSATQELARKVEVLEASLDALKKENAQLKSNATRTDDILKLLSAKVESLSQNLEMTGHK